MEIAAERADKVHELCNVVTTLSDAKEHWGF